MFVSQPEFWSRAGRRVGWALTLALALLLLQSAFWSERVPLALKLGVGAVAVLAAFRPSDALVAVAGLAPLGLLLATSVWHAYPFAMAEACVLAFLAGYLWHERRSFTKTAVVDSVGLSSGLFALVIFASCLAQLAELQVWHNYPLQYASGFVSFLATGYLTTLPDPRPWVDGRAFVSTAALLLEGVGLLLSTRTLCTQQRPLARRLTNVSIAAGVGVALLSFYEPLTLALSSNQSLASVVASKRWSSPGIPSLDTAGPYFMLVAFVAIGTAAASRRHLIPGLLAGVICLGGLWLARTRSAIVAGLATAAAGAVWWVAARVRWLSPVRAVLVAALIALAVGISVVIYNPFHVLGTSGNRALYERVLFAETALRMMASAPLSGVGIGRYELRYREFAAPEMLHNALPYYNAHNYFLWIGAELGIIGLGLFLWLVGAALAIVWSQLNSHRSDYWFLGTSAGLIAFVITWSIGQPLGIPQVAYTFWIVLGLAIAHPAGDERAVADGRRPSRLTRIALAGFVLVLLVSVPIRAQRAIAGIDLSRVSYGFYNSNIADNRNFRWAGPRVRFFERSSVKAINLPLAAKHPDTPNGAQVEILVNGRTAERLTLADREWHDIRVNAPASDQRFWQVDLNIEPIGVSADLPEDRRRICVGEPSVERRQEEP